MLSHGNVNSWRFSSKLYRMNPPHIPRIHQQGVVASKCRPVRRMKCAHKRIEGNKCGQLNRDNKVATPVIPRRNVPPNSPEYLYLYIFVRKIDAVKPKNTEKRIEICVCPIIAFIMILFQKPLRPRQLHPKGGQYSLLRPLCDAQHPQKCRPSSH